MKKQFSHIATYFKRCMWKSLKWFHIIKICSFWNDLKKVQNFLYLGTIFFFLCTWSSECGAVFTWLQAVMLMSSEEVNVVVFDLEKFSVEKRKKKKTLHSSATSYFRHLGTLWYINMCHRDKMSRFILAYQSHSFSFNLLKNQIIIYTYRYMSNPLHSQRKPAHINIACTELLIGWRNSSCYESVKDIVHYF